MNGLDAGEAEGQKDVMDTDDPCEVILRAAERGSIKTMHSISGRMCDPGDGMI